MTTRITKFNSIPSFVAAAILLALCANSARAGIYQWEYNSPNFPSIGVYASSTLAPDGAAVEAVPDADLHSLNLTMAPNPKQLQKGECAD